jgi:hypothetical protein
MMPTQLLANRINVRERATEQIVGRERRGRVSQLAWCGEGGFDSRRRVNSNVRLLSRGTAPSGTLGSHSLVE